MLAKAGIINILFMELVKCLMVSYIRLRRQITAALYKYGMNATIVLLMRPAMYNSAVSTEWRSPMRERA